MFAIESGILSNPLPGLLVFYGFLTGLMTSMPPGPSSMAVMTGLCESKRKAFQAAGDVLLADLIISSTCLLLFRPLSQFAESNWVTLGAGVFLILFAYRAYGRLKTEPLKCVESGFKVTISNPGCWLCILALIALTARSTQSSLTSTIGFLIAFEIGVLFWYSAMIIAAAQLPTRIHLLVLKLALIAIAIIGAYFVAESTLRQVESQFATFRAFKAA